MPASFLAALPDEATRLALALLLGFMISSTYRLTSRELSPSQGFMHAVVATCVIATIVVRATNAMETAFVVVGILSLLRFRTVVRDTAEFTFILLGLAVAIALGTSHYVIAVGGCVFTCAVTYVLFRVDYGSPGASPYRLKIRMKSLDPEAVEQSIRTSVIYSQCLGIQKDDEGIVTFHYEVLLGEQVQPTSVISSLESITSIVEVSCLLLRRESGLKDARE